MQQLNFDGTVTPEHILARCEGAAKNLPQDHCMICGEDIATPFMAAEGPACFTCYAKRYDLRFYVIFSVDCPRSVSIASYRPNNMKRWCVTEKDEQYEFDHLGGDWKKGKHRKWVAEDLTLEEFEKWWRENCLFAEDVETMGSLTEMGLIPAISFSGNQYDAILNAYVTPYFAGWEEPGDEDEWEAMREYIIENY